jgi:hypothetical protein
VTPIAQSSASIMDSLCTDLSDGNGCSRPPRLRALQFAQMPALVIRAAAH